MTPNMSSSSSASASASASASTGHPPLQQQRRQQQRQRRRRRWFQLQSSSSSTSSKSRRLLPLRRRPPGEHRMLALCGHGLYGGMAFVWQPPILLDSSTIFRASLGLSSPQIIATTTAMFIGWTIGSAFFGAVADRTQNRKNVALAGSALAAVHHFVVASLRASANNNRGTFVSLLLARLMGGLGMGAQIQGFTLALEQVSNSDPSGRMKAPSATLMNVYYAFAISLVALIHMMATSSSLFSLSWRNELRLYGLTLAALATAVAVYVPASCTTRKTIHNDNDERKEDIEERKSKEKRSIITTMEEGGDDLGMLHNGHDDNAIDLCAVERAAHSGGGGAVTTTTTTTTTKKRGGGGVVHHHDENSDCIINTSTTSSSGDYKKNRQQQQQQKDVEDDNEKTRRHGGRGAHPLATLLSRTHIGIALATVFAFVSASLVYYSLSYQAGSIGGGGSSSSNVELNIIILALLDLPGNYMFGRYAARPNVGVVRSAATAFACAGSCLVWLAIVSTSTTTNNWKNNNNLVLRVLPAFLGKMCAEGSFQGAYLLPSELLPPNVQSTALGLASSCARLATAAIPSLVGMLPFRISTLVLAGIAFSASAMLILLSLSSSPSLSSLFNLLASSIRKKKWCSSTTTTTTTTTDNNNNKTQKN